MPGKFISLIQFLYANIRGRFRELGKFSTEFSTRSGVFVPVILECSLYPCENNGIDILSHRNLFDLECADDVVPLSKDPRKLQVSLDHLNEAVDMFGMIFRPSKFKMRCGTGLVRSRTLFSQEKNWARYMFTCIPPSDRISEEVSLRVQ